MMRLHLINIIDAFYIHVKFIVATSNKNARKNNLASLNNILDVLQDRVGFLDRSFP